MAKIIPFKAVRPTRDKVSLVASRSYQTYTQAEREARLDYNPFSFLHIVNPGYKYDQEVTGVERYTLVRNRYLEFKEDNIFVQDASASYYIYKIVNREGFEFNGIIAAASTKDYENNIIKKHEDTLLMKEHVFKDYLKTVGFNAEPVLLTYPDNQIISQIIEDVQKERAEFEFTTTYRDTHYLWLLKDQKAISKIQNEFESMQNIYIADGHHRSASSFLLSQDMQSESETNKNYNYFMSYLLPESAIRILSYTRLVRDLRGHTKTSFNLKLSEMFIVEELGDEGWQPEERHEFCMYIDHNFHSLRLRKEFREFETPLDSLDSQILYSRVLKPVLGISNLKNDQRLAYGYGEASLTAMKDRVDSGEFAVGFSMAPASASQIKSIADAELVMPPKSTYIEPKLRSGLTIYEF